MAYLDEVLPLGLGDQWLQLRGREGVDKARLRHDQKQDLCARKDRQFVSLQFKTRRQHGVQTSKQCKLAGRPVRGDAVKSQSRRNARMGPCGGMGWIEFKSDAPTSLLHDTGFPLRESDMPTRLVADKLDLDLATLATALLVVVVVIIVGSALALTLDAATLGGGAAIAVAVVEVAGRLLVVLVGDVGHCFGFTAFRVSRYHENRKTLTNGGDAALSVVPMVYT